MGKNTRDISNLFYLLIYKHNTTFLFDLFNIKGL